MPQHRVGPAFILAVKSAALASQPGRVDSTPPVSTIIRRTLRGACYRFRQPRHLSACSAAMTIKLVAPSWDLKPTTIGLLGLIILTSMRTSIRERAVHGQSDLIGLRV